MVLLMVDEKPYDRVKIKFTNGQYHIHEIPPVYDLELIRPTIAFYIEEAKEYLEIDESVDLEYARALREGDDEETD